MYVKILQYTFPENLNIQICPSEIKEPPQHNYPFSNKYFINIEHHLCVKHTYSQIKRALYK